MFLYLLEVIVIAVYLSFSCFFVSGIVYGFVDLKLLKASISGQAGNLATELVLGLGLDIRRCPYRGLAQYIGR